jgi:hypothetical protein
MRIERNNRMNEVSVKQLQNLQRLVRLVVDTEKMPLKDLLSNGNRKLPSSTAIFNITPAKSCPSMKLGLCKALEQGAKCYASKAENLYPNVLPYRVRQMRFWKNTNAVEFAKQFIFINSQKKQPYTAIRINESGDFTSQKDINKAEEIARILGLQGIKAYCYSSRSDLDFSGCKNLIVSGSNFTKKGISNVFKIVKNENERPKGYGMCKGDCKICNRCQIRNKLTCVIKH